MFTTYQPNEITCAQAHTHIQPRDGKLYVAITPGGAMDVTESVYWAKA